MSSQDDIHIKTLAEIRAEKAQKVKEEEERIRRESVSVDTHEEGELSDNHEPSPKHDPASEHEENGVSPLPDADVRSPPVDNTNISEQDKPSRSREDYSSPRRRNGNMEDVTTTTAQSKSKWDSGSDEDAAPTKRKGKTELGADADSGSSKRPKLLEHDGENKPSPVAISNKPKWADSDEEADVSERNTSKSKSKKSTAALSRSKWQESDDEDEKETRTKKKLHGDEPPAPPRHCYEDDQPSPAGALRPGSHLGEVRRSSPSHGGLTAAPIVSLSAPPSVRIPNADDGQSPFGILSMEEESDYEPYYPALSGCRNVDCYTYVDRVDEGQYGVVYKAKDNLTQELVALKKLKMDKEKEGFPITSLREINCLLKAKHPNIVNVREIVVGSSMDMIYIVMDFAEHDLKDLMTNMNRNFRPAEVKTLMQQLLRGVALMHEKWILHRDLKTSNLLLTSEGILKIADFGLAREYGDPIKPYTPLVVTLWYRCPELLLGEKIYSTAVDMWSVGCIFAELLTGTPLFEGRSEIDQVTKIYEILGTPNERIWPGYSDLPNAKKVRFKPQPCNLLKEKLPLELSEAGFDLINAFLTYDPKNRMSAREGLSQRYFREPPIAVASDLFPTFPTRSDRRIQRTKQESPPAPAAHDPMSDDDGSRSGYPDLDVHGSHFSRPQSRGD